MNNPSKIVIIGAPRSGTNMLRDMITRVPGVGTWPCDEINYIWRYGQRDARTDALAPASATPRTIAYIRGAFDSIARSQNIEYVVEKTCANSLRVDFVDRVLPDARYIYIVRDGRDAAVSAVQRWQSSVDLAYTLKKVRYVPPADVPYYAATFLASRATRTFGRTKHVRQWGPRCEGLAEVLKTRGVLAASAFQWASCVNASDRAFESIDPARVFRVRYEELVQDPAAIIRPLLDFAFDGRGADQLDNVVRGVSRQSVGRWRDQVSAAEMDALADIMAPPLARHGYTESHAGA